MSRDKDLNGDQEAQNESLRAAGKIYTLIANHLHRSKGCIGDFVTKRCSCNIKRQGKKAK